MQFGFDHYFNCGNYFNPDHYFNACDYALRCPKYRARAGKALDYLPIFFGSLFIIMALMIPITAPAAMPLAHSTMR